MKNTNKALGLSIAALAATAAGAYYLYGSNKSAVHRKNIKSWMLKAKADVMDEIEQLKEVNEEAYKQAIAKVAKKYKDVKGMDREELVDLVKRLQGHWKDIKREIERAGVKSKPKRARISEKTSRKK